MRYPPRGVRGVAKLTRATGFGMTFDDYFAHAHEWLVTIPQIETAEAVANSAAIAAIDGVDVLFVGPMDLTTSLGIPGAYEDARAVEAFRHVATSAKAAGKAAGHPAPEPGACDDVPRAGLHLHRAGIGRRRRGGGPPTRAQGVALAIISANGVCIRSGR